MHQAGSHSSITVPSTGPQFPTSIEQRCATACRQPDEVGGVGELRHDLHLQHEVWLIEQYLEVLPG